jgi:hypothetical protein
MDISRAVISQTQAALEMLRQAIDACPEALWHQHEKAAPFWQVAYHALYYTYRYLHRSDEVFTPWENHQEDFHRLGTLPAGTHGDDLTLRAYSKAELKNFLTQCRTKLLETMPQTDFKANSGFEWLPFDKLELQLYNLRHLQQHIGELLERLSSQAGVELDWVTQG